MDKDSTEIISEGKISIQNKEGHYSDITLNRIKDPILCEIVINNELNKSNLQLSVSELRSGTYHMHRTQGMTNIVKKDQEQAICEWCEESISVNSEITIISHTHSFQFHRYCWEQLISEFERVLEEHKQTIAAYTI